MISPINRKESLKENRKILIKPTTPPPPVPKSNGITMKKIELPNYDDVSNLSTRNSSIDEEEYLTPPPPRPIYSRPPTVVKCTATFDEIYDDIGSGTETNGCQGCSNVDVIKQYPSKLKFEFCGYD